MSTSAKKQVRKPAAERRREIVEHAAALALDQGLERVTVRAVAESLGVRPGLIGHYFPAIETLVVAAFELAAQDERAQMVPATGGGSVLERLAAFATYAVSPEAVPLAKLWLNARHLCRFMPALGEAIGRQEDRSRELVRDLVAEGLGDGTLVGINADAAAIQILIAFDGVGAYVNTADDVTESAYETFMVRVAELACGLVPGALDTPRPPGHFGELA